MPCKFSDLFKVQLAYSNFSDFTKFLELTVKEGFQTIMQVSRLHVVFSKLNFVRKIKIKIPLIFLIEFLVFIFLLINNFMFMYLLVSNCWS